MKMIRNVVVAMSGGVDSAVTALLLKDKGFNITGVFMKNWDVRDETEKCMVEKDYDDARWICDKLEIPLIQINFIKEYWNEVFSFKQMQLQLAQDSNKDQTFFLSQVPQQTLRRCMFPLGNYLKNHVKMMATQAGLCQIARKKESTGICFVGKREFQDFISEYIVDKPGDYIDLDSGLQIGKHDGIHKWTIGQRCKIAGCLKSYYVFNKDQESNTITVVGGTTHPALYTDFLITQKMHWICEEPYELRWNNGVLNCNFRFQHRNPLIACKVYKMSNGRLFIRLDAPLRAITKGQYAVLYSGEECLGSSMITYAGPSYFALGQNFIGNYEGGGDLTDFNEIGLIRQVFA
ncbi:mitochondrial tRNA-specific 2-thiouridylase 1 isoform X3 [Mycetomoellerius zeteki]|uniref:mitochondrial tRNA-specific 2-thiouridylase 1 isoform X3 n=1 Tax=Mycetomoellerius zeteki TaxID=64791 RepID=UPI00084E91FB|nr:PREDICTED: mitochondrial tRNA-specific 2-thiouridylase 1 isoform X3 [Trachymyrmex zeteki]